MRYDFVKNQKDNQFYPVSKNDIEEVEETLGLKFPFELRKFLLEVGYGSSKEQNIISIVLWVLLLSEMLD